MIRSPTESAPRSPSLRGAAFLIRSVQRNAHRSSMLLERISRATRIRLAGSSRKTSANLTREGRFDYCLLGSTGILEPPPAKEPRPGRRTTLTFPVLPPPQKN
jgi:hypothetical protein